MDADEKRSVYSGIIEKKGRIALWLLLSAGVGFFAPLKSFILQWIIDSGGVRQALLCLLGGVLVTVSSHLLELNCRRAWTKLACGAMADIRRRVMKKALCRSMEKARERRGIFP